MRKVFWEHITEAKERILKENPEISKKDALKMAREQHQPQHVYAAAAIDKIVTLSLSQFWTCFFMKKLMFFHEIQTHASCQL